MNLSKRRRESSNFLSLSLYISLSHGCMQLHISNYRISLLHSVKFSVTFSRGKKKKHVTNETRLW